MKTELTAEKLLEIHLIEVGGVTLQINDNRIKEACINAINEAITVTRCCTELRDEYLQPELDKYKNIKVEQTKGRSDM